MIKTIFVLWYDNGESYDDHYASPQLAFEDKAKAEELCRKLNNLHSDCQDGDNEGSFNEQAWALGCKTDVIFYDEVLFSVEEMDLVLE